MKIIADLHIHSRFSRATSGEMNIASLDEYASMKGITLLATGDFTHPIWFEELKEQLKSASPGLYRYKETHFILQAEVNTLFYRENRAKNVHCIILAPSLEAAETLNKKLWDYGNLAQDGRPILKIEPKKLVDTALKISQDFLIIPAHVWTPHFSLFGANSGFDSVEECFGEHTEHIFALETGLSSDPAMNWRLSALDRYTLVSNSDSHSPAKIGREANIFDAPLDYFEIVKIIKTKDTARFLETIEFFPEEGKYHYDGHRNCNVCMAPPETVAAEGICPKCHRRVTVGVMHRVETLADRPEGARPERTVPFRNMIPLGEIIADVLGKGVQTKTVTTEYMNIIKRFGTEFAVLLDVPEDELCKNVSPRIASAVIKVRQGAVNIHPGYDGEYGRIEIPLDTGEEAHAEKQMELF
ncbi:MAG: DNA helicase UvrD [Candidatus Omnitrophica bacterium]|nr:DNA helicase UvrD [Candidatus Omnitrophota bacterium]